MSNSRPTLKDIAVHLKLSHPTVSRALADHEGISEETKKKVRAAARRLGYVANSGARMLRRGKSNVVGLLLPDITNEFYSAVAQSLAHDCGQRGQELLLSISADDPDREHALVRALMEARPSGLIVAMSGNPRPETIALLKHTYCVQLLYVHPEIQGPIVTAEDGGGARLAVEHLLDLGHRRIGFVGPPEKSVLGESRLRGLNQALKSHRVRLPSELIRLGPSTSAYGYEAVESLLSLPEPPTAIHLTTMQLSTGGVRAISKRGLRLPQDLSVVVAGSAAWYEFWPGGLTSTSLPMAELAGIASNLVFRQPRPAAGESHPFVSLAVRLIERGSTAELGH